MEIHTLVPASSAAERLPARPWWPALAWGIISFIGFIVAVTMLVWPAGQLHQVGVPHVAALGVWAFSWVLTSGLVVLVGARIVFGGWCEVRLAAALVLVVGAFVSAAQIVVLSDWTIARFGSYEVELAGPTSLLFAVVAGVAVSGFGVQVAPRGASWSPLLPAAASALLGTAIVLSNVPGAADGLAPDSLPLAAVTVLASLYIGGVAVLSIARLRRAARAGN